MKANILCFLLVLVCISTSFCQQKQWESDQIVRIANPRIQDLIKNSNLSATNFDNDGIADFISLGKDDLSFEFDSLFYVKLTPSTISQGDIYSCLDYYKVLPSSFGNFEIQDKDIIFLGFAEQPLEAQTDSPYNDAVLGVQNNDRIIAIIIAEFPSEGEATFKFYDGPFPYMYLSSGDYDDDGLSEFLLYDPESRKLQIWGY